MTSQSRKGREVQAYWTGTSLTERCGRIVIFPDENPGTSGIRSPDELSNESRTTLCRSGSSEAFRVSSEGTMFLTIQTHREWAWDGVRWAGRWGWMGPQSQSKPVADETDGLFLFFEWAFPGNGVVPVPAVRVLTGKALRRVSL